MLKGALFDLDGVIADTSIYHFQAWQKLARDHFDIILPPTLEEQTKGISRQDSLQLILNFVGVTVSTAEFTRLAAEKNAHYLTYLEQLTPANTLPGILPLIQTMQAQGIKLALASASLNAPAILEKLQLADVFEVIVDPTQTAHGKPAPDLFLAAAAGLALRPEECVGLEDSAAGIEAINAANCFSVGIGSAEILNAADLNVPDTALLQFDQIAAAFAETQKEGANL